MYSIQPLGSRMNLDPVVAKEIRTSGATSLNTTSGVAPCLEPGLVGGTTEGYLCGAYNATFSWTTAHHALSWAIALAPISSVLERNVPLYLEYSICAHGACSSPTNQHFFPFFGQESGAGTPAQGFDNTNNLVPEYHLLPCDVNVARYMCSSGSILLRDVISSGINNDDINMIGFGIVDSSGSATVTTVNYTIYARYVTGSLSTSFKGT